MVRPLALALLIACLASCNSPTANALKGCEEGIQRRLKAPSTYKRVKYQGDVTAGSGFLQIEYDAANSYNVPIIGTAHCFVSGKTFDLFLQD